jgi:NAD(P)-dependent dehydrogenase (short-subunit alcohol dehydrogenase family)
MGRLEGQVAVVTGAGSGIGRATALALAGAGARVALVGRRAAPLEEVRGLVEAGAGTALVVPADIAESDTGRRVVEAVVGHWDRLDVLVNNAGMNVPGRALDVVTEADWQAVLQVNLTGTFLLTQAALPVMRRQGSGTVVNVSSIAGYRPSPVSGPAYSAAKAAVNSFTESVNQAERRHGIRACAICPGEVATPIMDRRPVPPTPEERAAMLQPEDLAETVLLVASLPKRAAVELVLVRPTSVRPDSP